VSESRSLDTRTKILEIAESAFARDGYGGAHLQRIASEVGVRKTALYYYFPSKAALYEAVLERMLGDFQRTVSAALDGAGSPPQRLLRLLDDLSALLAERRSYSQILIRVFVDRVEVDGSRIGPLIEDVVGRFLAFHRDGVERGDFVKMSSRHLFQTLLGALVFHYATGEFGAGVLGVEDLFTRQAVAWRRDELRRLVLRAVLRDPLDAGSV
jgi:TetR/AcrR family transcriptional regulator